MKILKQNIPNFIASAIGAIIFMTLPILGNEYIDRFANISHWVDIKSIEVSNIDIDTLEQDITINRKVKRELNGIPKQELFLVTDNGEDVLFDTPRTSFLVSYEPNDTQSAELPRDFWINKDGVEEDLRKHLTIGQKYKWVWVIEFIRPNGQTEISRYESNIFEAE
jgi:hypothetical protein